jgi:hypothetical protein
MLIEEQLWMGVLCLVAWCVAISDVYFDVYSGVITIVSLVKIKF